MEAFPARLFDVSLVRSLNEAQRCGLQTIGRHLHREAQLRAPQTPALESSPEGSASFSGEPVDEAKDTCGFLVAMEPGTGKTALGLLAALWPLMPVWAPLGLDPRALDQQGFVPVLEETSPQVFRCVGHVRPRAAPPGSVEEHMHHRSEHPGLFVASTKALRKQWCDDIERSVRVLERCTTEQSGDVVYVMRSPLLGLRDSGEVHSLAQRMRESHARVLLRCCDFAVLRSSDLTELAHVARDEKDEREGFVQLLVRDGWRVAVDIDSMAFAQDGKMHGEKSPPFLFAVADEANYLNEERKAFSFRRLVVESGTPLALLMTGTVTDNSAMELDMLTWAGNMRRSEKDGGSPVCRLFLEKAASTSSRTQERLRELFEFDRHRREEWRLVQAPPRRQGAQDEGVAPCVRPLLLQNTAWAADMLEKKRRGPWVNGGRELGPRAGLFSLHPCFHVLALAEGLAVTSSPDVGAAAGRASRFLRGLLGTLEGPPALNVYSGGGSVDVTAAWAALATAEMLFELVGRSEDYPEGHWERLHADVLREPSPTGNLCLVVEETVKRRIEEVLLGAQQPRGPDVMGHLFRVLEVLLQNGSGAQPLESPGTFKLTALGAHFVDTVVRGDTCAVAMSNNLDECEVTASFLRFLWACSLGREEDEVALVQRDGRPVVQQFLGSERARVLLGAYKAVGVGLNLQHKCQETWHLTLPDKPSLIRQGVARVARHGQARPTRSLFFVSLDLREVRQVVRNLLKEQMSMALDDACGREGRVWGASKTLLVRSIRPAQSVGEIGVAAENQMRDRMRELFSFLFGGDTRVLNVSRLSLGLSTEGIVYHAIVGISKMLEDLVPPAGLPREEQQRWLQESTPSHVRSARKEKDKEYRE